MDEPTTPGVGEKSEQLTTELAEVLKLEKELAVCIDDAEAIRKTEIIINKLLARLDSRGGFRTYAAKGDDGNHAEIFVYDWEKVEEFQESLDDIGLEDVTLEATDEIDNATNVTVGHGDMSTVYEINLKETIVLKEKYALQRRRINLYNLMVKVRRYLGDDIPWNEDLSDRSMTAKKLDSRFESDDGSKR